MVNSAPDKQRAERQSTGPKSSASRSNLFASAECNLYVKQTSRDAAAIGQTKKSRSKEKIHVAKKYVQWGQSHGLAKTWTKFPDKRYFAGQSPLDWTCRMSLRERAGILMGSGRFWGRKKRRSAGGGRKRRRGKQVLHKGPS